VTGRSGTHLREPASSFVGRRQELGEIRETLARSRIVTLTGPGGAGKTRLVLRTAAGLSRTFRDGVRVAELGNLTDDRLVAQTVGEAVAPGASSPTWTPRSLAGLLADRHLLLILDGCEQVSEACAEVITELAVACPELHILSASRHALGVDGEMRFPVPPLSLTPPGIGADVEALMACDAVQLFAERAPLVAPGFVLDATSIAGVHQLCWRLDGIPLAIELAAARLSALSVAEILERLDDDFSLLSAAGARGLPHQRTLEATMRWSYDLLTVPERILWRRLCVFSGTFSLDAAENVCSDKALPPQAVAELLARLVEKSMVTRAPQAAPSRYRLLETLRHFGTRRLVEAGEEAALRLRHCDWVASVARGPDQPGSGPPAWFARMAEELPNLRAALDHCLATPGEGLRGLALCTDAWAYWRVRGPFSEGQRWLTLLLSRDRGETYVHAKALWIAGAYAVLQNDLATGEPLLMESARIGRLLQSNEIGAASAYYLGLGAYFAGDMEAAERWAHQSATFHRASENRFGTALIQEFLGQVALARDDLPRAREVLSHSLDEARALGEVWLEAYVLWALGLVEWRSGLLSQAEELAETSLRLHRSIGERTGLALAVESKAWFAVSAGDAHRAARLLGEAERMWQENSTAIYGPLRDHHAACEAEVVGRIGREQFDELRRAAEPDVAGSRNREARSPWRGPLSRREFEVARLISTGMTNRAIANRLLLSQRTVDSHVDHILTKLGQRSRVEIATWVQEQAG
jgi:predicted ATPase/DNA-binding CsgD family transcriptional regulator